MSVRALATNIRQSARKVRLVADAVRGLKAPDAVRVLQSMNKRAATPVLSVVQSAMANAQHNAKLDPATLTISQIAVDEGFTIKRFRARAFGRAAMIRKRTSRIAVTLSAPAEPEATKTSSTTSA